MDYFNKPSVLKVCGEEVDAEAASCPYLAGVGGVGQWECCEIFIFVAHGQIRASLCGRYFVLGVIGILFSNSTNESLLLRSVKRKVTINRTETDKTSKLTRGNTEFTAN